MTVTATARKAGPFLGNGVTTVFPFAFKVFAKTDLAVTRIASGGAEIPMVLDASYSVTLNADQDNNPGGVITYPLVGSPLAVGETLSALGAIPYSQGLDLSSAGTFLPQAMEDAFDRQTIMTQQLAEKLGRALLGPVTDLEPPGVLPRKADLIGKFLVGDVNGNFITSSGTGADVGVRTDLASQGGAAMVGFRINASGAVTRSLGAFLSDRIDVKNFGAFGDSASHPLSSVYATLAAAQAVYPFATALTDEIDWCAFQAAVNSIPTGSSYTRTVFVPTGLYVINKTIDGTGRNIGFMGEGPRASVLLVNADSIVVVKFDAIGCPAACIGMMGMAIQEVGSKPGMVGMTVRNTGDFFLQNVYISTAGKAIDIGSAAIDVTFSMLNQVRVECYGAQEAIRFRCGGGNWSNIYARKQRIAGAVGPCLWITGQTTSLEVSNCAFGGKGAGRSWKILSITGTTTFFDVLTNAGILQVLPNEVIVIRNTGTAYDGTWKVSSLQGTTTARVLTTANLGSVAAPANAFLEKQHAIVYMENGSGPVNESLWSNVLFEGIDDGGSAGGVGSVSLYMDATVGDSAMASHQFTGCTFDGGQIGVLMNGKNQPNSDYLISDIRFNGMIVRYAKYGMYLREVRGVHINDFGGDCLRFRATAADQTESTGIYLDGISANPCIGVTIANSTVGRQPSFHLGSISSFSASYGFRFSGVVQEIRLSNSHFFGLTSAVLVDTTGVPDATSRIVDVECTYSAGAGGETAATRIPGVAAAATISLPFGDIITISGASTTITTINGGWVGRKVLLITTLAQTLSQTGGNIANQMGTAPGHAVRAVFDGTKWHVG